MSDGTYNDPSSLTFPSMDKFKEFLADHPAMTFKGDSKCKCPLAVWLSKERDFAPIVRVGTENCWHMEPRDQFYKLRMPEWAAAFSQAVDEIGAVDGARSLEILTEIENEETEVYDDI